MSQYRLLSNAQWSLIEDALPRRTGRAGRPFADARTMVEAIIYRYRCGIAWRDLPAAFGRLTAAGTWDLELHRLLADAVARGLVGVGRLDDRPRASARDEPHSPHRGWIELHESGRRAA